MCRGAELGEQAAGLEGEHAGRREPGLSLPLGEGCVCMWTGQETILFLAVRFRLAVLGWEKMSGAEDGADMGLVGCVSDGRGKGDVGVYSGVFGTMGSLLEGAILEIPAYRELFGHSHKPNCGRTWSLTHV